MKAKLNALEKPDKNELLKIIVVKLSMSKILIND